MHNMHSSSTCKREAIMSIINDQITVESKAAPPSSVIFARLAAAAAFSAAFFAAAAATSASAAASAAGVKVVHVVQSRSTYYLSTLSFPHAFP